MYGTLPENFVLLFAKKRYNDYWIWIMAWCHQVLLEPIFTKLLNFIQRHQRKNMLINRVTLPRYCNITMT